MSDERVILSTIYTKVVIWVPLIVVLVWLTWNQWHDNRLLVCMGRPEILLTCRDKSIILSVDMLVLFQPAKVNRWELVQRSSFMIRFFIHIWPTRVFIFSYQEAVLGLRRKIRYDRIRSVWWFDLVFRFYYRRWLSGLQALIRVSISINYYQWLWFGFFQRSIGNVQPGIIRLVRFHDEFTQYGLWRKKDLVIKWLQWFFFEWC